MALPGTGVIEVDAAAGNDANGGMFDPSVASPGTDKTYGAGQAATAYADLVIGGTSTQLTSAAHPFGAADVGNTLAVPTTGGGFTAGRYSVRSVSGATATVDRSVGTAGSTGGAGTLGGALASRGQAALFLVSGNTVWVKAGTYTLSAAANVSGGRLNFTGVLVYVRGYQSARGDNGTRPVFDAGAATMTLFAASSAGTLAENLDLTNSAARASVTGFSMSAGVHGRRLRATGMTGKGFDVVGSLNKFSLCEAVSCAGGFDVSASANAFYGCVSRASTTYGFRTAASCLAVWDGCVASGSAGAGFSAGAGAGDAVCNRCVAHGSTGASGHGFDASGGGRLVATGCVAYGNAQKGFTGTAAPGDWLVNCAGGSNTGGDQSGFLAGVVEGFITLTADPFTNAAGLNFTPNNTAGGGALLRAAGWPATLPGLAGSSYPDAGAFQHQDAAAGGVARLAGFGGGLVA